MSPAACRDLPEVDTLPPVTPAPADDDPEVFDTAALVVRYAMTRQGLEDMREARGFPEPTRVGKARRVGSLAWSRAQVWAWEARPENVAWVAHRRAIAAKRRAGGLEGGTAG